MTGNPHRLGWLARQTGNVAAVNYLVTALNLFTGVLTARVMGPGGKGVYYAVMAWTGVAGTLALLGLPSSMAWFLVGSGSPRLVYSRFTRLGIVVGFLAMGVFLWPVMAALRHISAGAPLFGLIGLLLIPLGTVSALAQMLLQLAGQFAVYNVLRVWRTIVWAATAVALAILGRLTADALIMAAYIINGIPSAMYIVWAGRALDRHADGLRTGAKAMGREVPSWSSALTMALGYFLPSVASTFNTRLDQMLNTIWLSSASIGRYGVALSGLSVGFGFLNAFQMVFFAAEVGGEPSIILKKVAEASRALTIVAFALVAVTIIAGRFVLLGFYGSRYDGAYVILLSLILSVPLMTVIGAVYQAFGTLGKPLLSFVSEMTGAVTGGLLLWALTPRFGAVGAGAADTLSYGCDLAVVLWQWTRIGGRVGDLVPRRPDAKRVMSVAGRYVVGVLGERIRRRSGVAS